jgi:carbon storage regulator
MLVLNRKPNQTVRMGAITVTVLAVRDNVVKLGFSAPADVPIHRDEVLERCPELVSLHVATETDAAAPAA